MAETVGSIMGNHCGKGRVLTPENFSDELYLGAPPPCTSTQHLHPAVQGLHGAGLHPCTPAPPPCTSTPAHAPCTSTLHIDHSYPEFNLGPLFMLKDLASQIYEKKKRNYVFKRKPSGHLATYFTRLRNNVEGSAVDTHRRLEAEKAHLPTSIWNSVT